MENIHELFEQLSTEEVKKLKLDIHLLLKNTEEFKRIVRYFFYNANPLNQSYNADSLTMAKLDGEKLFSRFILKNIIEENKPEAQPLKQKTKI